MIEFPELLSCLWQSTRFWLKATLVGLVCFVVLLNRDAAAQFVVTSTNCAGPGSLIDQINLANATNNHAVITFSNPPGLPAYRILLCSNNLPALSNTNGITIDGTTQPGFTSTPIIEVDGTTTSGTGLVLLGDSNTIRGIALYNFKDDAIGIQSRFNHIENNFIGMDSTGTNVFGNAGAGIYAYVGGDSNEIIGNAISGNTDGISLHSSNNKLNGNSIGTDRTGKLALGNSGDGVYLDSSGNTIGGTNTGEGNVIAFNFGAGICTDFQNATMILGNSIYSNSVLGIDLNCDGVTLNDFPDTNGLQNFPLITNVISGSGGTIVQGTLSSLTNTSFILEFFANADTNCFREGQKSIGTTTVTTGNSGTTAFITRFSDPVQTNEVVTATATSEGALGTSEFSDCAVVKAGLPDLTGFWPSLTNRNALIKRCTYTAWLEPRTALTGAFIIQNVGLAPAPKTVAQVWLSNDGTNKNVFLANVQCPALLVNQTNRVTFHGTLPVGMVASNNFLVAILNVTNRVNELNTNNNLFISSERIP
jgi:parallel beta-helix repeat protein